MNLDKELWGIGLVGLLAAVAATLYGSAALWALGGRASRLLRLAPLALLLAALVPLGAYELVALFATQAIVAMRGISLWQSVRARRAAHATQVTAPADGPGDAPLPAANSRSRFLLSDLLKAIVLIALVAAIVRHAPPLAVATGGATIDWWPWIVAGGGLGIITLAAVWTAQSCRRWYLRAIVFVVATLAGGVLEAVGSGHTLLGFAGSFGIVAYAWCVMLAFWQCFAMLLWLLLLQKSDWASWRRIGAEQRQRPLNAQDTSFARSSQRLPARIAACGLCLLAAWILGSVFLAILPPAMPEPVPLPKPNGYDDLLQAGQALNWTAVPGEDADEASVEACQAFVLDNSGAFTLMRQAFSKPCRLPVEYTAAYASTRVAEFIVFRSLARALNVEARAAFADGRPGDALRSYLDMIRMGQEMSRGGLLIHELVGNAIAGVGYYGLVEAIKLDKFDAADLLALRQGLQQLDASREPFDAFVERDQLFTKLSYGWQVNLFLWADGSLIAYRQPTYYYMARAPHVAELRLLLAEAAIRGHLIAKGSPPDSLASLVPEYLSAVPQDPFGSGPLVYRRTAEGYLLYSLGSNGKDDGGERVSWNLATRDKGDLFFDAITMPFDTQNADGSAAESDAASSSTDAVNDEKE